jgi:hypothetical protein
VALEVELSFEGVVDRLYDLPQWLEVLAVGGLGLSLPGGAEQGEACGEGGLEVAAVVAADDDLPWAGRQAPVSENAEQDEPLVGVRARQGVADGQAVQSGDQVQPQSPEPARVAGAVPVLRPPGQFRAPDGFAGAGALDRGSSPRPRRRRSTGWCWRPGPGRRPGSGPGRRAAACCTRSAGQVRRGLQLGYRQRTMTVRRTPASSIAVVRCRPLV